MGKVKTAAKREVNLKNRGVGEILIPVRRASWFPGREAINTVCLKTKGTNILFLFYNNYFRLRHITRLSRTWY
jgi:hypothetical protein